MPTKPKKAPSAYVCPIHHNRLMYRSMIYTAIPRVQEQVVLIGDKKALENAILEMPAALKRKVGFPTWLHLANK